MTIPPFLRNLTADLVGRRLWPVAVALLVALVAVPVVIRGGAEDPVVSMADAPAGDAADATSVTLAEQEVKANRRGALRNPFTVPPTPKKALPASGGGSAGGTPAPTGGTGADVSGGSGGDMPSAGGWGEVPGVVPVDAAPAGPTAAERASWRVDLRFGRDGDLASRTDVPRLSPLPSAEDPFFVFLGVLADGKTALFLVSSDAQATGDGTCLPSPEVCDRVEMQAGETEFFDVTTPEGETQQYQLDIVRVDRRTEPTAEVAAAKRSRESSEGREVLREAVRSGQVEVSDLAYSRELGLVVPSGEAGAFGTSLFGGFRVDLRFGAPGALVKRYNLARLTPLPSVEEPSFVYLGVLGGGETALFLNPTEAAASGDAVCLPSPDECQRVELKAGQEGVFAAPTMDGQTKEYVLSVDDITRLQAATVEEARAGRHRESPAGREILRRLITEVGSLVGDLRYQADTSTLEPAE